MLAIVVAGAGCGSAGGGGGSSSEGAALLERAFAAKNAVQSGDLKLRLRADVEGLPSLDGPLELRLDGPFKSNGRGKLPSLDWGVAFEGAGQKLSGGVIATQRNAFLRFQGRSYALGESTFARLTRRLERSHPDRPRGPGQLGLDPAAWLKNPKVEDGDPVGGDDTRKVTGSIDVRKLVRDLVELVRSPAVRGRRRRDPGAPPALRGPSKHDLKAIEDSIERVDVELNVDGDDVLRRFFTEVEFNAKDDGRGKDVKGRLSLAYVLRKVGGDPVIRAPAGARPLSELVGGLGLGALGGALGGPKHD